MLLVLGAVYILSFQVPPARRPLPVGRPAAGHLHFLGGQVRPLHLPDHPGLLRLLAVAQTVTAGPCCCSLFPLFFQALFFFYLYAAYGSFSPNAVYYGMLNPEQSQALVRHHPEEDPAAGALGDPARLFLRPARRPAAVQSFLLLRLSRAAAGPEKFPALPPAPARRPAGQAVHPQSRLLHHPRRLLPPGTLPGAGRLGADAVRPDLLPGKPQPAFAQGLSHPAPLPALRHRLSGAGAVHPLPAHHPRFADPRRPLVPGLEQQPHRPAGAASLLHQDRQPGLPAQRDIPGDLPAADRAGAAPLAPENIAPGAVSCRRSFSWAFFPWPAFSPGWTAATRGF